MPLNSQKVHEFADEWWRINLTTSSPRAQSNGQEERAIQTVNYILRKADEAGTDPYAALLQYRNTSVVDCDYSPTQNDAFQSFAADETTSSNSASDARNRVSSRSDEPTSAAVQNVL